MTEERVREWVAVEVVRRGLGNDEQSAREGALVLYPGRRLAPGIRWISPGAEIPGGQVWTAQVELEVEG